MEKKFFLQNYVEFLIKLVIGFGVLYLFLLFITPKTKLSDEDRKKIETLDEKINEIIKKQNKIDSTISKTKVSVDSIDILIAKIKTKKTIIREIYHGEINRVAQYNDAAIDSFFTNRYGYYPSKNITNTDRKVNN